MRPVSAESRWHERFEVPLSTGARPLSSHTASLGVRQSRWRAGALQRPRLLGQAGVVPLVLAGVRDAPAPTGVLLAEGGAASRPTTECSQRSGPPKRASARVRRSWSSRGMTLAACGPPSAPAMPS